MLNQRVKINKSQDGLEAESKSPTFKMDLRRIKHRNLSQLSPSHTHFRMQMIKFTLLTAFLIPIQTYSMHYWQFN